MARTTSQSTEKDLARITVCVETHNVDLAVPIHLPVESLIQSLVRSLDAALREEGNVVDWLSKPKSHFELSPLVGKAYPGNKTLSELGVLDASRVILTTQDRNEQVTPLIDDLAEAGAVIQERDFRAWDNRSSQVFSSLLYPAAMALLALVAGYGVLLHGFEELRWPTVGVLAAIGVWGVFMAMAVSKWAEDTVGVVTSQSLVAYATLPVAAACAVPGELGRWHGAAAGAVLLLTAGALLSQVRNPLWLHWAMIVPGASALLIGGLNLVWPVFNYGNEIAGYAVSACVAFLGFLPIAFRWGVPQGLASSRLSIPSVPSTGEEIELDETANLVALSRATSGDTDLESIISQRERSIDVRNIALGINVGSAITIILGCFFMVAQVRPDTNTWVAWTYAGVLCTIVALHGTWYPDRAMRASLVALGVTGWVLTGAGWLIAGDETLFGATVLGGVVVVVLMGTRAWRDVRDTTPRMRRWAELGEYALYALPIFQLVMMLDVFSRVRNR